MHIEEISLTLHVLSLAGLLCRTLLGSCAHVRTTTPLVKAAAKLARELRKR